MLNAQASKNIKLYPKFYILFHSYAWASVFFLYFLQNLPIEKVLLLESIYYMSAVFFEVPSGYFSDRIGRKQTLIIASLAQITAYLLFILGSTFAVFAVAQVIFAIAFTFASGTDQSFFYESVVLTHLKDKYGQMEAQLMKKAMLFRAFVQLLAGVLCVYSLKLGYGLSLVFAVTSFFIILNFTEINSHNKSKESFWSQLKSCFNYWQNPVLLWVTFFIFIFTIVTHFPYEFFQKYIDLLDLRLLKGSVDTSITTLGTGAVASAAIFIAAFVAGQSVHLKNKIGFKNIMMLSILVNILILFGMSYFLSSWILLLILMRSIPAALSRAPMMALVSPLIDNKLRATFMSMNSLIGRLGYGVVLYVLSQIMVQNDSDWPTLSYLNKVGLNIAIVGLVILFVTSLLLKQLKERT